MFRQVALALALSLAVPSLALARGDSKSSDSKDKPVHVETYTRKDGTKVKAHDRHLPDTAPEKKKTRSKR